MVKTFLICPFVKGIIIFLPVITLLTQGMASFLAFNPN